jgi:hypothetical protein
VSQIPKPYLKLIPVSSYPRPQSLLTTSGGAGGTGGGANGSNGGAAKDGQLSLTIGGSGGGGFYGSDSTVGGDAGTPGGGGGGGYSGGGGSEADAKVQGAGGGGSFYDASIANLTGAVTNTGSGYVDITNLTKPAPPMSATAEPSGLVLLGNGAGRMRKRWVTPDAPQRLSPCHSAANFSVPWSFLGAGHSSEPRTRPHSPISLCPMLIHVCSPP